MHNDIIFLIFQWSALWYQSAFILSHELLLLFCFLSEWVTSFTVRFLPPKHVMVFYLFWSNKTVLAPHWSAGTDLPSLIGGAGGVGVHERPCQDLMCTSPSWSTCTHRWGNVTQCPVVQNRNSPFHNNTIQHKINRPGHRWSLSRPFLNIYKKRKTPLRTQCFSLFSDSWRLLKQPCHEWVSLSDDIT